MSRSRASSLEIWAMDRRDTVESLCCGGIGVKVLHPWFAPRQPAYCVLALLCCRHSMGYLIFEQSADHLRGSNRGPYQMEIGAEGPADDMRRGQEIRYVEVHRTDDDLAAVDCSMFDGLE